MFKRIFIGTLALCLFLMVVSFFVIKHHIDHYLTPPQDSPQALAFDAFTAGGKEPKYPAAFAPENASISLTQLESPHAHYRPWTRWWWPGTLVDTHQIEQQLTEIHHKGFAGVELQAFTMGTARLLSPEQEERMRQFGTPEYYSQVIALLEKAQQLGMKVDLTNGSGWPAGGPHIGLKSSLKTLVFGLKTIAVDDSKTRSIDLPKPKPNANDYGNALMELLIGQDVSNFQREDNKLMAVIAGQVVSGGPHWNPLNVEDTTQLDQDSIIDLSSNVFENKLLVDLPVGDWAIIAVYQIDSGEAPVLGATVQPGFVLNHLNRNLVEKNYDFTLGEQTGLAPYYGNSLHGIFNDSLEFKLNRMTSADILSEFKRRRGYDLTPYLPLLSLDGADNFYLTDAFFDFSAQPNFRYSDLDGRIRRDYRLTLSDLMVERFINTSAKWLQNRNMKSRAQSYGMDLDVIRALGANHVPETEQLYAGGANNFLKMAGAAGALYNRNIVSAESFVWSNKDYLTTPLKLKIAADKLFASGINRIIYHGTSYQPSNENLALDELGWFPWSSSASGFSFSSNISQTNPFWQNIPELNKYLTRCQYLLQQGKPDYDVLIHYPFLGIPSRHERDPETDPELLLAGHLSGVEPKLTNVESMALGKVFPEPAPDVRNDWLKSIAPYIKEIEQAGLTWTWVNSHAIVNHKLQRHANASLIFFNAKMMELSLLTKLQRDFSDRTVVFIGQTPKQQPSYLNASTNDKRVKNGFEQLKKNDRVVHENEAAHIISELSKTALLQPTLMTTVASQPHATHHPLKIMRRRLETGSLEFISNQSDKTVILSAPRSKRVLWWDPIHNEFINARNDKIALRPFTSLFKFIDADLPLENLAPMKLHSYADHKVANIDLERWSIQASDTTSISVSSPSDIDQHMGLLKQRQTLVYTTEFSLSKLPSAPLYLNTQAIHGSASIDLNGVEIGQWALPPFITDLTPQVQIGVNKLTITLTPSPYNFMASEANKGNPEYRQFKGRHLNKNIGLYKPVKIVTP